MKMILASASPRRRQLLEMLGVRELEIVPAHGKEVPPEDARPEKIVEALALAKAQEVARGRNTMAGGEPELIIAADTIVWNNDQMLGKPRSRDEAYAMLRSLSGNTHEVYTGIAVIRAQECRTASERTRVTFRELSDEEIYAYIATGEPMDKAGAYGIQERGSLFVTGIEGDYFNVVGLPVCRLGSMLKEMGVRLI